MKIICDSCGAKYTVSDDKVQGKTVKVKCRKCSAVIVVSSSGEVSTAAAGAAHDSQGAAQAGTYTVSISDGDQRQMTVEQVVAAYNDGTIDAETYVWTEGMGDWQPLREIDRLVDALHSAADKDEGGGGGEDLSATVAMSDGVRIGAGAYGAAPASAPTAIGLGAAPTAIQRAVPKAAAAKADVFSGRDGGNGASAFGFQAASAAAAKPVVTGGEENSAIFSLSMLTAKAAATAPTASAPSTSSRSGGEDSGLIDLKALAAGGAKAAPMGMAVSAMPIDSPLGGAAVFPLGAPAPPPPTTATVAPPAKSNTALIAILGGLVLLLGAALVFFMMRGGGDAPAASSAVAAPSTPTPATTTPAATTTQDTTSSTATPSESTSASGSASVAAAPTNTNTRTITKTATTTGATTHTKPPPPPPTTKGPCGCDPNDLMCNMRCKKK